MIPLEKPALLPEALLLITVHININYTYKKTNILTQISKNLVPTNN
jgi:hypothetical protein